MNYFVLIGVHGVWRYLSFLIGNNEIVCAFFVAWGTRVSSKYPKAMNNDRITASPDNIHIGQLIKNELERQGRSITWLAKQIGCTRSNLYKLFRNPWINTQILFKISKVLNCDFFKECSDWYNANAGKEEK